MITWDDFAKIDMRVGTIVNAQDFPEARNPAYKLWIDFGERVGIKKTSAQITTLYDKTALLGKQVIAVINFPSKQIADFMSECLVLGTLGNENEITLLTPERKVTNGLRVG